VQDLIPLDDLGGQILTWQPSVQAVVGHVVREHWKAANDVDLLEVAEAAFHAHRRVVLQDIGDARRLLLLDQRLRVVDEVERRVHHVLAAEDADPAAACDFAAGIGRPQTTSRRVRTGAHGDRRERLHRLGVVSGRALRLRLGHAGQHARTTGFVVYARTEDGRGRRMRRRCRIGAHRRGVLGRDRQTAPRCGAMRGAAASSTVEGVTSGPRTFRPARRQPAPGIRQFDARAPRAPLLPFSPSSRCSDPPNPFPSIPTAGADPVAEFPAGSCSCCSESASAPPA